VPEIKKGLHADLISGISFLFFAKLARLIQNLKPELLNPLNLYGLQQKWEISSQIISARI